MVLHVLRFAVMASSARLAVALMLAMAIRPACADTLTSESSVSLEADYNSNPFLLPADAHSAESVAALGNLPLTYSSNAQIAELIPRVRLAESRGDDQLLTDFEYLDGDWRFNSERTTLTATALWHRDSTLYNAVENSELLGHTLPRIENSASLAWQQVLSERNSLQLSAGWDEVRLSSRFNFSLDNYTYTQGAAQFTRTLTERLNWSLSGGVGRYDVRNLESSNDSQYGQSSLVYQLTERWTATAQGGYSRVQSSGVALLCCEIVQTPQGLGLVLVPVVEKSSGGTANYLVSSAWQAERFTLDLSASRTIQPSSLGSLLTQNQFTVHLSLPWSEHVKTGVAADTIRSYATLASAAGAGGVQYDDVNVFADWQASEHWTVSITAAYSHQHSLGHLSSGSDAKLSLTFTRGFGRVRL
jgi:hypothetical protein